jgi:hypothetical protein
MVFFPGRKTMSLTNQCDHCGRPFEPDPRVKNQRYCSDKDCQRARKRKWQKEKLLSDPDYRANQRDCQKQWHQQHPGYYKQYRDHHPRRKERNRLLQRYRNSRRRPHQVIAKMDAFKAAQTQHPAVFYLLPLIAKMDALAQKVIIIPIR